MSSEQSTKPPSGPKRILPCLPPQNPPIILPSSSDLLIPLPPPGLNLSPEQPEQTVPKAELFPYQKLHADQMVLALSEHGRVLDASDTGTGKTYVALDLCAQLGLRPFIICPKSVLGSWMQVTKAFGLEKRLLGIANYELLQNCRYFSPLDTSLSTKVTCPYITRKKANGRQHPQNTKTDHTYTWSGLPPDTLVIFDEAHRCKNPRTVCSVLLYTLSLTPAKIIMLSATISDKPKTFSLAGFVLGLYPSLRHAMNWIRHAEEEAGIPITMAGVHRKIYPKYASRMRIKDLGDLFPKNHVMAECYDMDTAKEIQEMYQIIEEEVARLKRNEDASQCMLAKILYARMRIEQLKIPTFLELIRAYLAEGNSVAVFVNFTNTLRTLAEELKTQCLIFGEQSRGERDGNIEAFQQDLSHLIICNIRSGGVGISLHDTRGDFPRVSIISPSWSAQDIVQALGRIHRANGKTPVRQRIVFCRGTVEEMICQNMIGKIKTIAGLNDGELGSYEIEGLMTQDELGVNVNEDLKEVELEVEIRQRKIDTIKAKKHRLKEQLRKCNKELEELGYQKHSQTLT